MRELFTVYGKTDGSSTTGDFKLYSDLFYYSDPTSPTKDYIRIPKGLKAKIWCKRISGEAVEVIIKFTKDVTAASPTWAEIGRENLASAGEFTLEKRRPIVVRSITGKEAIRFSWSQPSPGNSYFEAEIEFTDE